MPFKYQAITANCGNDGIGIVASQQIAALFVEPLDFVVLNCQEADFKKTKSQLEKELGEEYTVACVAEMPTHTKIDTQFHHHTGIATLVICKKDKLAIDVVNNEVARRTQSRFGGRGYNKGGVVADFTVRRADTSESITVQAVSGHLDANHMTKRNEDWSNLHKASSKKPVGDWDDLVNACPNLKISGYDANTRNKLSADHEWSTNLLYMYPDEPEVQALHRAHLGNQHFSTENTYDKGSDEDRKRPGYSKQGMLDYIAISDGSNADTGITTNGVIAVEMDDSTHRDHYVVISPVQTYEPLSEFEKVKGQMASSLERVAPELAERIRSWDETNKDKLVDIYNQYLSRDGLLNKAIILHTQKLTSYNQLKECSFIKKETLKQLSGVLFSNTSWCDDASQKIEAKQSLMDVLLESLEHCQHDSGIKSRLALYEELHGKIEHGEEIDAVKAFKLKLIQDYLDARNNLETELDKHQLGEALYHEDLQNAGHAILSQLDLIVDPNINNTGEFIDPKSLDKITRIAINCKKMSEAIYSGKTVDGETIKELKELSHEASSRTSFGWKVLGSVLKLFVRAVSNILGLDVTHLDQQEHREKLDEHVTGYKAELHKFFSEEEIQEALETPTEDNKGSSNEYL